MTQKHKFIYENGKTKEMFLVKKENVYQDIHYLNWVQNKLNQFRNISIKPYEGKRYNKDLFCWIVIG